MPKKVNATEKRFAEFVSNSNLIESISELSLRDLLAQVKNIRSKKSERTHVGAFAFIYNLAQRKKSIGLKELLEIQAKITSEQLVLGHTIAPKYIGAIRDCPVRIGFGVVPIPTHAEVKNFLKKFNQATKKITRVNFWLNDKNGV